MNLIVGLGNPDKKYEKTRHNIGFMVLDKLVHDHEGKWQYSKKFNAEVARVYIEGQDVMLIKPQTYMNKSGESVRSFVGFLSIPTDRVWLVHDDVDLDLGTVRVRTYGSSGGHKGVLSVISCLGTEKLTRFRIGIKTAALEIQATEKFVLGRFTNEEEEDLKNAIEKTGELISKSLQQGIEHTSV